MSSRQLAAIMFTDMVGYTALMGKDSAKALELVRISKEIQKPLVEKHQGQWLKEMGDGALAKFGTALDAVNCAVEIQEVARAKFDGKLRIGIHSGDITIENNDVYGDGVNIASRLESITDPGGIYISESIEKAIRGQTDVQAKYLGEIKLKNVAYGVRTYAVQGVGLPIPKVNEGKELSGHFWAEVLRRGVIRAAVSYLVVAVLLVLLWGQVQDWGVDLPQWSFTLLLTVLGIGIPLALYLAWNYEKSPEGFVKTTSSQSWQNPLKASQRKPLTSSFIIVGLVLVITIMYLYPRFFSGDRSQQLAESSLEPAVLNKSIAVLPFKDDSPDSDNQYFADGMMDEILNHLQKITELGVKSRTAVEPYRNSDLGFATKARELDVAFVLEGAVRKYGNRFRVTTQLIEVESGNHLWAETYDGIFSDTIFVVQANIAKKIASSLRAVITPDEEEKIDRIPTADIAAYDLYVRARHERILYWKTFDKKHLKTSHDLLDNAIQIDPEYLMAIAAKGETFMAEQNYDSALVYAERVLVVDPEFNRGYGLKGECYFFMGNFDLAIENYLKAIDLPPKDNEWLWYHAALGRAYVSQNQAIMAFPYLQKALEMADEFDLQAVNLVIVRAYTSIGDFEKAEAYSKKVIKNHCFGVWRKTELVLIQGKFQEALQFADSTCQVVDCERECSRVLFRASLLLGEFEQAELYFNQWRNSGQDFYIFEFQLNYELGYVYHQLGRTEEAEKIFTEQIEKLESELDRGGIRPYLQPYLDLARIYAFTGVKNKALNYLSKSVEQGFIEGWHDFILIDPFFKSLRDDPEFKAIVKQAQEEKAALRAQVREMEERGELNL